MYITNIFALTVVPRAYFVRCALLTFLVTRLTTVFIQNPEEEKNSVLKLQSTKKNYH